LATHAAGVVRSVAVTVPPAPAEAVITTVVAAKVALMVAAAVAVNEHGLVVAPPVQVIPAQLTRWKPEFGVAVICMLSLMAGLQLLATQSPGFVRSAAVTAPPAPAEALIATVVATNVAVSVSSAAPAGNAHDSTLPWDRGRESNRIMPRFERQVREPAGLNFACSLPDQRCGPTLAGEGPRHNGGITPGREVRILAAKP